MLVISNRTVSEKLLTIFLKLLDSTKKFLKDQYYLIPHCILESNYSVWHALNKYSLNWYVIFGNYVVRMK